MLRISLLGAFQVDRDGELLSGDAWRGRQMRTILKVLAVRSGEVVLADQLIEILWPDEDPAIAHRHLYVRVSQLRHALHPGQPNQYIQTIEGGYLLEHSPLCWIDLFAFREYITQGRRYQINGELEAAIAVYEKSRQLYHGPFLEEDLYEEWTQVERELLSQEYLELLTDLAECYALRGRFRQAVMYSRQVLKQDPCREAAYLRLMLYHYYSGEQDQALHVFEQCRLALQNELAAPPSQDLLLLAEQIRTGRLWAFKNAPRYPPPVLEGRLFSIPFLTGKLPFVGRQREYSWLVERWHSLPQGIILIEGEAGVGKTRLVEEFLDDPAAQAITILRSGLTRDTTFPYAPIIQALCSNPLPWPELGLPDPVLATLSALIPELHHADLALPDLPDLPADLEKARLFSAVEMLVQALFPGGALFFIDDAHLCDPATLDLLGSLAQSASVLLTCRSEDTPAGHPLRAVCRRSRQAGRFAGLKLAPLSRQEVTGLLLQMAGANHPALFEEIASRTDGNPLFIQAWLQHLFETGIYYIDSAGSWSASGQSFPTAPETIRQAINNRLAQLSSPQQRVFDLASIAGHDLGYAWLQHACELPETALLDAVDQLIDLGLLVEPRQAGCPELSLSHSCYAEVNAAAMPAWRKQKLYQRAAAALLLISPDLDLAAPVLAHYFLQADQPGSAFDWLVRAGDVAQRRFAHVQALEFYQRAIDLGCSETAPVYDRMGHIAHHLARYTDGARYYEIAIERWAALGNLAAQIQSYYALGECARELSDFRRAAGSVQTGLTLASDHPELPGRLFLLARGHIILSNALRSGQIEAAVSPKQHLLQALEIAEQIDAVQIAGEANFWLGVLSINTGEPVSALAYDQRALDYFKTTSQAGWLAIAHNNLAYHALLNGQPHLAMQAAQAGLKIVRAIGSYHSLGWLLSTLGEIQYHLASFGEARQALVEALELVETWGPARLRPGLLADLALLDLAEADWSAALARLESALSFAESEAPQFLPRLHVYLAQALLQAGCLERAMQHSESARATAHAKSQRSVEGQAWRIQGLVWSALNQPARAIESFERSLALLAAAGNRLEVARTQAAWGKCLLLLGRPEPGQALINQARAAFEEMQAGCDLLLLGL